MKSLALVWEIDGQIFDNPKGAIPSLKHGDLLSLKTTTQKAPSTSDSRPAPMALQAVDGALMKRDGRIYRPRDAQYCKHSGSAMCDYCSPLDCFDARLYQDSTNAATATASSASSSSVAASEAVQTFKHKSFHAWLRELSIRKTGGLGAYQDPWQTNTALIEEPRYGVLRNCRNHGQGSRCSACQVPPITLKPQPYRMVDHVEFLRPSMVDSFVEGWRATGYQSYGLLLGSYSPMEDNRPGDGDGLSASLTSVPPLGIKAVIETVFEPLQDGSIDGFELVDSSEIEGLLDQALSMLGLVVVGMMYTDLMPREDDPSKVKYLRNKESFFVSGFETNFMADKQAQHPFFCPWARASNSITDAKTRSPETATTYDSRFVTVIVSGNEEGHVDLAAYQVSRMASQLIAFEYLTPSTDPRQLFLNHSKAELPEFLYRGKANELVTVKDLVPVEYLLVNLTVGFKKDQSVETSDMQAERSCLGVTSSTPAPMLTMRTPMFKSFAFQFNRVFVLSEGNAESLLRAIAKHLEPVISSRDPEPSSLDLFYDFGLFMAMLKLANDGIILSEEDVRQFADLIRTPESGGLLRDFLAQNQAFQTLLAVLSTHIKPNAATSDALASHILTNDIPQEWTCQFCTYHNFGIISTPAEITCEMCGLPRA